MKTVIHPSLQQYYYQRYFGSPSSFQVANCEYSGFAACDCSVLGIIQKPRPSKMESVKQQSEENLEYDEILLQTKQVNLNTLQAHLDFEFRQHQRDQEQAEREGASRCVLVGFHSSSFFLVMVFCKASTFCSGLE